MRVTGTLLRPGQELLLGSLRYRFDAGELENVAAASAVAAEDESSGTAQLATLGKGELSPSLVELRPQGVGKRFLLTAQDNWIGRDPTLCLVVLPDNPLASPRAMPAVPG